MDAQTLYILFGFFRITVFIKIGNCHIGAFFGKRCRHRSANSTVTAGN
jgi:hypothetical protein